MCDQDRFTRDAGLFHQRPRSSQLYDIYDDMRYGDDVSRPRLVTTDAFWEAFGAPNEDG